MKTELITEIAEITFIIATFRVRRSRGEMYIGHGRLCVGLSVPRHIPTLLHGPGCKSAEWLKGAL